VFSDAPLASWQIKPSILHNPLHTKSLLFTASIFSAFIAGYTLGWVNIGTGAKIIPGKLVL
jgi:hypothetical protein